MSDVTARARELLDGITPGPWEVHGLNGWIKRADNINPVVHAWYEDECHDCGRPNDGPVEILASPSDAQFIAAAPTLVADLLAEVERLRARIQGMTGGDAVASIQGSREAWITAERDDARAAIARVRAVHERSHVEDDWYICDACSRMTTDPIDYPCETIRALDGA